jgi:hypothetical protein
MCEEMAFLEDALVAKDIVKVGGRGDYDAWGKGWDGYRKGLRAGLVDAVGEPGEEFLTSLKEENAVADERESVGWIPVLENQIM